VIGGQRTAEARMRLAFVGQRAITFGPLRRLFGALLAGAVLQLADVLCAGVCSALTALLEGPRATQLAVAQLVLSLAHLALARASLRAVPPRLAFYLAGLLPYTMSRRCWAALPAVANAAYALESLLPVVCAPLAAGLVSLVTWLVLIAFWAVSSLLVRFAAACVAPAGATLPTRLLAILPTALAYLWGAFGTVGTLVLSCALTSMLSFYAVASLLGGVEQAGVQRQMHSRVAIDPEVELDELRLDGELNYRCEELLFPTGMHVLTTAPFSSPQVRGAPLPHRHARAHHGAPPLPHRFDDLHYDALRLLMDGRALLMHASLFLAFDRYSVGLWADLEATFAPAGVFSTGLIWSPLSSVLPVGINPFHALLHGLHLPAAMVCLARFA
jgi:hypothetical protein